MEAAQAGKVERFKKRIDFDAVLMTERAGQVVSTVWPDMRKAPGLSDAWTTASDTTWREKGGTAREWVMRRGPDTVAIVFFVSADGVTA
ncbi:MAG TPA: hypothetical protein VE398_03480, partial [Acidobacteriota bacterium]|nr:hypothetical protein [Acidobacteriota bacterium]